MKSPLKKRELAPLQHKVIGFVQTMYFDLEFNYINTKIEQTSIFPDSPNNWESETCKLIPHVWYEFTRVSKKNPESSKLIKTQIDKAKKKVKFFAEVTQKRSSVLRIVGDTIVTKLHPNVDAISNIDIYYLEESYRSLALDDIASQRQTREMPPHLKEKVKAVVKKNDAKSNRRRAK